MGELGFGVSALVGVAIGAALFVLLTGGRLRVLRRHPPARTVGRRWVSLVGAAGVEEAVWRGLVLGVLVVPAGPPAALAVSSAGFAAWHWRPLGRRCWLHVLTGAGFGAAFLVGGLLAAILAHGLYNVLVDWAVHAERARRLHGP